MQLRPGLADGTRGCRGLDSAPLNGTFVIRKSGFKTDLEASQAYNEAFIQHGCFELNFPTEPWHTQAKRPTAPAYTGVSYEPLRNSWRVSHTAGGRI